MAKLIRGGMSVARLNLSHGTQADHQARLDLVRRSARDAGVGGGPRGSAGTQIRLGTFVDERVDLMRASVSPSPPAMFPGARRPAPPHTAISPMTSESAMRSHRRRERHAAGRGGRCHRGRVRGARRRPREEQQQGDQPSGVIVSVPALSEKDIDDLRWASTLMWTWWRCPSLQRPEDIDDVRRIMDEQGVHRPILAKIEATGRRSSVGDHRDVRRHHGRAR